MEKKKLGLYVHIPFCESKCDYCSFVSFVQPESVKAQYVQALLREIELQSERANNYVVDTIYIGGGTPSVLPSGSIAEIVKKIKSSFTVEKTAEISSEANPNSLTKEKLAEFKKCGINRLSIGLQCYNNRLLKLLHRVHNKKQFKSALKNAKSAGFTNINVDLLLGVPTQTLWDVKQELSFLIRHKVPHISAYGLMVEEGTRLATNLDNKVYRLPSEEKSVKMYDYTVNYLRHHKINRYEVSNFARDDYECKHNLRYWNLSEYLGLGLVSSSYFKGERTDNIAALSKYLKAIEQKKLPIIRHHKETCKDSREEYIMLGLRRASGIDLADMKEKLGYDLQAKKQAELNRLQKDGLLAWDNNRIWVTDKGFHLLNQIILDLME